MGHRAATGWRALGLALCTAAASGAPAWGQTFEAGLGLGVAETRQNAFALGSTFAWNTPWALTLGGFTWRVVPRGIADAELGVHSFKKDLDYEESPDSIYIVDTSTGPPHQRQPPEGDELWQIVGWDLHLAAYLTLTTGRIFVGSGGAWNGIDDTAGWSLLVGGYITPGTELEFEFLDTPSFFDGRWRVRLSLGFWRF